MRILVYGAGVLGSLCAARLHDAGHDVTILARGERLASIRARGIVVRDEAAGLTSTSLVPAIDRLDPADRYDVALVFVRREQRLEALPELAANATPTVAFIGNDATGGEALTGPLGSRLVLGFAMAGGTIVDDVVHARVARATSPTMLGEPDGTITERVRELAVVLASAGLPAQATPAIGAWLRTHAALVVPVAAAVYGAAGDIRRLAATPDLLLLTIRAVREGFAILRSAGVPITPPAYARLLGLPEGMLSTILARAFATDAADLMIAGHALHARAEMVALDADLAALAEGTGVDTPALDRLRAWFDPTVEPMERGSRTLVVTHPVRTASLAAASVVAGLALGTAVLRRTRPDVAAHLPSALGIAARLPSAADIGAYLPSAADIGAYLPSAPVLSARRPRFDMPVHVPAMHVPSIHVPAMHVPAIQVCAMHVPAIHVPLDGRFDRTTLPEVHIPAVGRPTIHRSAAALPHVDMPAVAATAAASIRPFLGDDPARTRRIAFLALLAPLLLAAVPVFLIASPRRSALRRAR